MTEHEEQSIRDCVRDACRAHNVQPVADALGLSAEATARLGGGLRVQRGTILVARENLNNLDALAKASR